MTDTYNNNELRRDAFLLEIDKNVESVSFDPGVIYHPSIYYFFMEIMYAS